MPDQTTGRSVFHCTVGTIRYHAVDATQADGYLLYIKPSLTGNEPTDILQYAQMHPAFPHESTTDQWFSESQFESYRQLGLHIARTLLHGAAVGSTPDREALFVALKERWYPASAAVKVAFSRHADQLQRLQTTLRSDADLRFLDAQIYPEWHSLMQGKQGAPPRQLSLPESARELRAGFYFCSKLLGLLESVYIDLDLEEAYDHPDNRGWLNLFKHWSWSSMLRVTYAICCATYGARFQTFCRQRLALVPGEVQTCRPTPPTPLGCLRTESARLAAWLQALEDNGAALNFEEARLVRDYAARGLTFDELILLRLRVADLSKPSATSAGGVALEFTYGFALANQAKEFVFFRVQDHLRRMGLARDGLKTLCAAGYREIAADMPHDDPASTERFQALLRSVREELSESGQS